MADGEGSWGGEAEQSISQHLFEQISTLIGVCDAKPTPGSGNKSHVDSRIEKANALLPYIQEIDGYLSFSEPGHEGQIPAVDWNSHFRKAYTLLLWIRPVLGEEKETTLLEDRSPSPKRILYKFATSQEDGAAQGVCVNIGDWRVIDDGFEELGEHEATPSAGTRPPKRKIHTTLTAYSLPHTSSAKSPLEASGEINSPFVTAPIVLDENEWALVGITHVFPYLKRPFWSVCVDGKLLASGELAYPTLSEKRPMMKFNTLFKDVTNGGAMVINTKPDTKKTATELQDMVHPRLKMSLHLASFSLSNEALSSTIQALLAQAGPTLSLQQNGALPVLPPIANWSKGSSLEGPNVGIPLVVHSQALALQRFASSCLLWGSAVEARLLGANDPSGRRAHVQRIVCRMPPRMGTTHEVPRVGLIQPTPPSSHLQQSRGSEGGLDNDVPVSFSISGACSIHHNLSDYLINSQEVSNVDTQLFHSTKHFSLLILEGQSLDSQLLMPFFLSLPPPGAVWDLQKPLHFASLRHLYSLYSNNAEYAACLLKLFTASVMTGGGRWHEAILQNGICHILSSTLRQSLVRAEVLRVTKHSTLAEFIAAHDSNSSLAPSQPATPGSNTGMIVTSAAATTMASLPISPNRIPTAVTDACVAMIDACCGPPSELLEELSPAMQIQRTSDLSLTILFGMALDLELWAHDLTSCAKILGAVASRFGGSCITAGFIMRSQFSVQHFLDLIKCQLDRDKPSEPLEQLADSCARILQAMLLSSLSNQRSISQGEHDISSCMGALSDCPLGSVGAHVIFTSLMKVLQWCEVFPMENYISKAKEEHKMQVAARLARNLMLGQFHDVIAPMLLSRTVFCGERAIPNDKEQSKPTSYDGDLSWECHWRLGLLIFSWVSSIAGPEGVIASKSLGTLMLASGIAGSLRGALDGVDQTIVSSLFLPPPAMALTIAATRKDEWSYTDLLSERLQVMMPLLPGLVVSIISHPSDPEASKHISKESLDVLSELLTAVGGSFYRVFGGTTHSAATSSGNKDARSRLFLSGAIKAAKDYVSHLLIVAMILENHICMREQPKEETIKVLKVLQPKAYTKQLAEDSWVEVSSTVNESFISDSSIPSHDELDEAETEATDSVLARLKACQKSVVTTISELLSNAMRAGGSEVSALLWRIVCSTQNDAVTYAARKAGETDAIEKSDEKVDSTRKEQAEAVAHHLLCRLAAMVLIKCLKRDSQWEVWTKELGSAVSCLCVLIEEKELLLTPRGLEVGGGVQLYTPDQILLIAATIEVLKYGRNVTGWCQLILPIPPLPTENKNSPDAETSKKKGGKRKSKESSTATSKIMLPVLRPCLRIATDCIGPLSTRTRIIVASDESPDSTTNSNDDSHEEMALNYLTSEVKSTLTAALVGMSFQNARDVALQSIAQIRRAKLLFKNAGDDDGLALCDSLLVSVVEEIQVRYQSERRRRETALFDAYEDEDALKNAEAMKAAAANDAQVIEKLFLGGDLVPQERAAFEKSDSMEEVSFEPSSKNNEDFVLFQNEYNSEQSSSEIGARMQWNQYDGLGLALDKCAGSSTEDEDSTKEKTKPGVDVILSLLTPYLDAWDDNAAKEAADSELVDLFDAGMKVSPDSNISSTDGAEQESESLQHPPILGAETAADAIAQFIEFAAVEKSRIAELLLNFLPNHRNSCAAFSERYCWARFLEIANADEKLKMNFLWERGIADGSRDIRSRIVTIPCSPQFRRYIPRYLDHSSDAEKSASDLNASGELNRLSEIDSSGMDAFTKSLLETAHLEIVDITKKENAEGDEPEIVLPSPGSMDDDGLFGDEPLEYSSGPGTSNESVSKNKGADGTGDDVNESSQNGKTLQDISSVDMLEKMKLGSSHFNITSSAFACPPDNSSSTLSLIHSAAAGMIEQHVENCLHIKAEGSRKCSMLLTATHLILEYDAESCGLYEGEMMAVHEEAERQKMIEVAGGANSDRDDDRIKKELEKRQKEAAAMRPKSIRWSLSELSHVYLRRYRLRDSSLEMFFIPSGGTSFGGYGLYAPSTSLFLDFGPGREGNVKRDNAASAIMKRAPPQTIKQWPDRGPQFLHEQLSRLTIGWVEGRITNFDYLLHLNMLAGRSYNDICQYPVMPWVLADYDSEEIPNLRDRASFRDLTKPMGALNPDRLEDFKERFNTFADPSIPPFMYGSHYSTSAGVVLHFLVRLHPYAGLHRQLQGGHFDVADRLFSSISRTWAMCTGSSAAEVKELTPEWYCNPSFLKNVNGFKLGTSQDGEVLGDVELPPWAKGSPETFIEVMRNALESDICSEMLPDWIDLIFGRKQQGPEAIAANNVFFYLTYYGSVDVASIEDEGLRQATELQIAHFGQCPMQLFMRSHVHRADYQSFRRLSFYQVLSAYSNGANRSGNEEDEDAKNESRTRVFGEPLYLPFFSAPMSHWVHLDAPPPGPHANLIGVRLAGTDRCLAVDSQGVFHCFRWAWKAEEDKLIDGVEWGTTFPIDNGCFVAQRELPRFRTVPRLVHTPRMDEIPAVAISKTLFAGRSVFLVVSDGDGRGAIAMQLVDPAKASVRGEVVVNSAHTARIVCIATDPIGTAAGHGGVGGELAIFGSADGTASIWRFMSSHYLPLRPRVRLGGHGGAKIRAVALNGSINIAATVSSQRCCLHSVGNGNLVRTFEPPQDSLDLPERSDARVFTSFADSPALAISVQGFVVTVCKMSIVSPSSPSTNRDVIMLHLFSLEGISLGSKPLETWRGVPHKMSCTPDGTAVLVCSGRGITIHRVSAVTPLEFIDEWHITETEELNSKVPHAWDVDLGPSLNRPVIAAAACSSGALRLHALAGISAYSERYKRSGISQSVGFAVGKGARRFRDAVGKGFGLGSKVVGVGKEIGKEVTTDVKERGVGGFLGSMVFRKGSK